MRVMRRSPASTSPAVWLGRTAPDSIAVSIYVVVRDGARRHPQPAAAMRGAVRIRFAEDHPPVRIDFRRRTAGNISALIAAPLAAGPPNPRPEPAAGRSCAWPTVAWSSPAARARA